MTILSVSQITRLIKQNLENQFNDITVMGEISGLKKHVSGHWYFNLKDNDSLICCAMWRSYNNNVFFTPEDGMKIVVNGRITVYPPRGNYQIDVRSMKPAGEGELQAAFERLKQKLDAEGLFDISLKKKIPSLPNKIGIVTAIDGAALKDMLIVAKRRFPLVEILIVPSRVQGEGAAQTIAESIKFLNTRNDIDVIIIGRGGGSLEDLWAFNEEVVARAIFASKIPVISAVGHEIDFTISDFAADLRAPTPSAAMELATPNIDDFFTYIKRFLLKSTDNISYIMEAKKRNVFNCLNSYGFRVPQDKIKIKFQEIDNLFYKIEQKLDNKMLAANNRLSILAKSLESNDYNRMLKKGFTLIKQDSKYITRASAFNEGNPAVIKFYDNEIKVLKEK